MKIVIAIVVASLVYWVLKATRFGLKSFLSRYKRLSSMVNLIVVINLLVWLAYAFWVTDFLFGEKFFYPYLVAVMILIIAGFLAWFLIWDIFAGVVFRVNHNLKNGSNFSAGDLAGQIVSQELTYLKIKTEDGQLLRVPYSKINHKVIAQHAYSGAQEAHVIHLQVDAALNKVETEAMIRATVMNTPWSSLNNDPVVKFLNDSANGHVYEVACFSMSAKQLQQIVMALEMNPAMRVIARQ